MTKLSSTERKQRDRERYWTSKPAEKDIDGAVSLVQSYKKKAVSRLKTFYEESQRMDTKIVELIEKAKESGVRIDKLTINSAHEQDLLSFRRKTKHVKFQVEATRDNYKLGGTLNISPASMQLELNCASLKNVTTRSGYHLPLFKITYYRTLNVRDNYLAALVGGGYKEVPF